MFLKSVFSLMALMLLCFYVAPAQGIIRGKLLSSKNEPAANASVLLLQQKDSLLIASHVCDKNGDFIFSNLDSGQYLLLSSLTGHQEKYSAPVRVIAKEEIILEPQLLTASFTELKGVSVQAKKPFLEQEADRLVVNVSGSPVLAGNSALQILERSPGVVVNRQNGFIALLGKDGVNILINGKPAYMPTAAIFQMLDGMNAGNIEKIELITAPSASLDAEGRAGYINIVLKQNEFLGTNGSFYGTVGYGKDWLGQAGLNFNHRSSRVNIFGDFSYSGTTNPFLGRSYNRISNAGDIFETLARIDRQDVTHRHNARLSLDYQLDSRTVAGILLTSSGRWYRQYEHTRSDFNLNGLPDTLALSSNSEVNNWTDYGINLNLQHQFKKGDNLSFNAYYLHYKNDQPFHYNTSYLDKAGDFIYDEKIRTGKKTPLNFWIAALDYTKKLSEKINLETGLKGTIAKFTNEINFEKLQDEEWIVDPALTATYLLKEDYSAAYASLNIAASKKTTIKGGLRFEYTNSNLETERIKNIVDRHYGKLFPTFHLVHNINEKNTFSLSYNSRITRPSFRELAPFTYFTNRNLLITGNPALQPSISHAITAGYKFKQYFLQVTLTKEDNSITFFQPEADSVTLKIVTKPENLDNQKLISIVLSIPVRIASWWNMQFNITGTWQQVNAQYQKEPVSIEQRAVSINMTQSFTLPKQFAIELSGFYNSPRLNGISLYKAIGTLDLGIRKKIGSRDQLNLSGGNLLNTMDLRGSANISEKNLVSEIKLRMMWRTIRLTYTRNFGKEKLRAGRERSTGAEDVKGRVQY